jgi:acetyl-CoA synthetase
LEYKNYIYTNTVEERLGELIRSFSEPQASAAYLLCDRHPAESVAYRVVPKAGPTYAITYGQLKARSERLASGFARLGIVPGDRVATLMSKGEDYLVTLLAIWRLGAVYLPLFTAFAPLAVEMRLASSGAKLIVTDAAQRPKLDAISIGEPGSLLVAAVDTPTGDDLSLATIEASGEPGFPAHVGGGNGTVICIFTSGTTGKPKGVEVPLRALAGFQAYGEFGLGLTPDDVFWNAADPGWAYGLYFGVIVSLATGVLSIMHTDKFSPDGTLDVLEKEGVTNFTTAPTVYRSLKAHGVTPGKLVLRRASSAGEPLTPDVNMWAPKALGVEVHDHFGQTEAGMLVNNHHHPALKQAIKPGSMGRPLPGWHMTIIDPDTHEELPPNQPGLLAAELSKSPLAWFEGYLGMPDKNTERLTPCGRWYLTGDVAQRDEQGAFRFASRDDDVILMAGYRIGPFDVESVLITHPAILEVAVVATPDEIRGEVLEAIVVLDKGFAPSDALTEELKQKVRTEYGVHAYPRRIHYRESLPKTPSGKVQRFVLRQELRAQMEKSE